MAHDVAVGLFSSFKFEATPLSRSMISTRRFGSRKKALENKLKT
jgi:hypothetical protein